MASLLYLLAGASTYQLFPSDKKSMRRKRGIQMIKRMLAALLIVYSLGVMSCAFLGASPKTAKTRTGMLVLELWADRDRTDGEPVQIRFTVRNIGKEVEAIQLEDKLVMDILVGNGQAERWSERREITPDMRRLELGPGESKTIEMTWDPGEGTGYPVLIKGILRSPQSYQDVMLDICVGNCGYA